MTVGLDKQRGYLLVTVVMGLFLLASIAVMLNHDSAVSANTANRELETARAEYVTQAAMQHALWRSANSACAGAYAIPVTTLGADTYKATIISSATTTTSIVVPDHDTTLDEANPDINYGKDTTIKVKNNPPGSSVGVLHYDVSSIAKATRLASATAWFYVDTNDSEGHIEIRPVNAAWTETSATWSSLGTSFDDVVYGMIAAQPKAGVWVSVNLTALVQSWVNEPASNFGIRLSGTSDKLTSKWHSRDYGTTNLRPFLQVTTATDDVSPVQITATGTLDSGVERTLNRLAATALQPPTTEVFKLGAVAGVDAYIWEANKTTNYGSDDETWASQSSNNTSLSLLRFPAEGIPSNSRIISARLSMHHRSGNNTDVPISAHRITAEWQEDSVTWNQRKTGSSWAKAGGDIDPTVIATVNVGPPTLNRYEWDIAPLVQGWVNGDFRNYGVALATAMQGSIGERFDTSDHTDPARRPSLTISYACECGNACLLPRGSGNVLMVIGNAPSNPAAVDASIRERFESWGYAVAFIQDDDSPSNFDAALSVNDVVYISDTVSSNNIGLKLTKAKIGIVSQKGNHNLELDIADGKGQAVGTAVNVIDTSHYITRPFPTSKLDIYDAGMEITTISTTKAAGLQTLADVGGVGSLVAIEQGDLDLNGSPIAGRRVVLPLGRQEFLNWDYINSNGQLLVQRALSWGMNTTSGYRILFVVGISDSLQTRDIGRRDLFESWGHAVTIIDDSAAQAEFDAELALNDVVYVGGTVVAGNLDTKLNSTTVGLVNEVAAQLDDFGFHDNATANTVTTNQFTATDAGHYISEPFAGSGVIHFTTNVNMPVASAPLAPNLGKVASIGTLTWAIPVLDTGVERWDGAPSPGRRVHLAFGEAEITQLTDDGSTLMQRSLEWAGGAGCNKMTPLLLVINDAGSPTSQETARQELIASSCYEVTLISDHASQADFDTALADVDVVYIAGSGSSAAVGTKLTAATAGILNEDMGLVDELGIAEPLFVKKNSQHINVIDNTHYLTSGFSLGALQLYSYVPEIWTVSGSLAPGLQLLAETQDAVSTFPPGLAVLEAGAELYGGGFAAGRRVQVPWAQGSFDINALNADGRTIMKLALEWAASPGPPGPIAHWKLDDGAGTTAIDSEGGHNGILQNMDPSTDWVSGQIGGGLDFDSVDDIIGVGTPATLDDIWNGGGTSTAWIYPRGVGANNAGRIVDKWNNNTNGWLFTLYGANQSLLIQRGFSGAVGTWHTAANSIQLDTWQHVAVAYDDSSDANDPVLYIDGIPQAVTEWFTPSGTSGSDAGLDLNIGNRSISTARTFDGILDDVRLYDYPMSAAEIAALFAAGSSGGGSGGGGGSCDGTFRDEFNARNFSGSDGTLTWAGNWQEVGESNGATSGDIQVMTNQSNYQLRTRDNDNGGEGVEREADLSGAAGATLSYDYRRMNLDGSSDYTSVEISSNGAAGPWTELTRHSGSGNDSNYQPASHNIAAYISANTRIRLKTSSSMGNTDTVWFDNIEIACSP